MTAITCEIWIVLFVHFDWPTLETLYMHVYPENMFTLFLIASNKSLLCKKKQENAQYIINEGFNLIPMGLNGT